jgi:hypothetical protein
LERLSKLDLTLPLDHGARASEALPALLALADEVIE